MIACWEIYFERFLRNCSCQDWRGCEKIFGSLETVFAFIIPEKRCATLIIWKNGKHLFDAWGMNLLNAVIYPVSFCTSFTDLWSCISRTALWWVASIPLWETRNPRNFPAVKPKEHLAGFNHMLCRIAFSNVSRRSTTWSVAFFDIVIMSSTYIYRFLPICAPKIVSFICWKVAHALMSPKGITWYPKTPLCVMNTICSQSWLSFLIWLYPEKASIKDNNSLPAVASMS